MLAAQLTLNYKL